MQIQGFEMIEKLGEGGMSTVWKVRQISLDRIVAIKGWFMSRGLERIGFASGVVSFLLCLTAGLWLLTSVGFDHEDDALSTAIGLYFVGTAFFVGQC